MIFYTTIDQNIKQVCYWLIAEISEYEEELIIEEIIKSNLLVDLINSSNIEAELLLPSIRIIGNLATNDDRYVTFLMKINAMEFFKKAFSVDNTIVKRESLWAFSNFTASSKEIVKSIIDDEDILIYLKKFIFESDFEVKKEILYSIGNIVENADYVILKKIFNVKLDDDIIACLQETKNPELIFFLCILIKNLINCPFYILNKPESKFNFFFN